MKTACKMIFALSVLALTTACNTVQGIGEDITSASESVEDRISGQDNKNEDGN